MSNNKHPIRVKPLPPFTGRKKPQAPGQSAAEQRAELLARMRAKVQGQQQ